MNKLKLIWTNLRESFWFLPSLIVAFSSGLALGLIEVDSSGSQDWMADWPRFFEAGAAGARVILATIAGSIMTVVGVTFSMTLVTLALASRQYTSRILRNFMSDHATQVVLGIFAGIFTYCLIVLRTIRGEDEGGFVPSLSVVVGVVLAIGGIGTLIFFIHRIASSIQASRIIASVTKETLVAESFDQIRGCAEGNVAILLRILGALLTIATLTNSPRRRRVLREQAERIAELTQRSIGAPHDQERIENRLATVREALSPSFCPP